MALSMKNKIIEEYSDGTVLVDISTTKYPSVTMLIDKASLDLIPNRVCLGKRGYPTVRHNGKTYAVHKIICNYPVVDHINRNRCDNRTSNLRSCTHSQNHINENVRANNTSGTTGVVYDKSRQKWVARIKKDYKTINLGRYSSIDDAIEARTQAERTLFGDFSPINA